MNEAAGFEQEPLPRAVVGGYPDGRVGDVTQEILELDDMA